MKIDDVKQILSGIATGFCLALAGLFVAPPLWFYFARWMAWWSVP